MYARGILFGKMKYELGDHSFVRCPEHGLMADIEFKTKGYFGGTYNAIGGVIKNERTGESLYELSGMWSGEMVARSLVVYPSVLRLPDPPLTAADREKGGTIQRNECKAYPAYSPTTRGTR